MRLPNAVPKPRPKRKPKPRYSSIPSKSGKEKIEAANKLKAGNRKRAKANHERAYGDHATFIRSLPCCVCTHVGHTVAAHTATGGKGRKADASTLVPLCCNHFIHDPEMGAWWEVEGCHEESHRGVKSFAAKYSVDLKQIAADLWAGRGSRGKA